ncbi:cation transporter [Enterococcus hirae]|uniref:cation diffusion facilitator family transporter n=1 Tax=Enterococcus TaxID=1350 RepID=UPI000FF89CF4|nr:cation diffusion facilitator family transporter [Enterococcus hirae]EMF0165452.1 cation transporter [Enterococcus hirae]EMF0174298.1 cation transporter [Enterococcus hirae]EMF0189249.1 cation transporter [Enterococcus hirae]EMF0220782.1 cation transporter [Enterococcus hirae]EMF0229729.1 cation transporter [Enterococcus hirae]
MSKEQKTISGQERTKKGIIAGILGLITNILLFVAKFAIGLFSGSVSIMADAINSLSDTASSILTLVGFKIAAKPADQEHPFGHERFEYISGLFVSIIITYVGFQFLDASIRKIFRPEHLVLTPIVFLVLIFSILLKLLQGRMYTRFSKTIQSEALKATAKDSYNDVFTTLAVLVSAGIERFTGWRIDGYVGFVLAGYIIFSGIMMLRDFVYELLGSRPTAEEIKTMEKQLSSYKSILGFHDLLVHNYGPNKKFASVHIEVDDSLNLNEAHKIIDIIEKDFKKTLDVDLVCHLDPVAIHNEQYHKILKQLRQIIKELGEELRLHDLRIIRKGKELQFDIVVPQNFKLPDDVLEEKIRQAIEKKVGSFELDITFDHNYLLY